MSEETPNPKIKLVYAGVCALQDGKRGGMFYEITDAQVKRGCLPDTLPTEKVFGWVVAKECGRPGAIHEFECPPGKPNSILSKRRIFVGRLNHDERVLGWQVNHDAFIAHAEMLAKEKAEKNVNLVQEQLEPLRIAFRSLAPRARAAFLAQCISYLTAPKTY